MTDAHCHVARGETRHLLCEPIDGAAGRGDAVFLGCHPWHCASFDAEALRLRLLADQRTGVGEIGLDRLKTREITPAMRMAFETQLELAAELRRPVVLHGAKCWGEVVATAGRVNAAKCGGIPSFLFHGFSRSGGLLPDIVALNGFVSVGPAVLNEHAVNYRELVKAIPLDRMLAESDATAENAAKAPSVVAVVEKTAELRGMSPSQLEKTLEANLERFLGPNMI